MKQSLYMNRVIRPLLNVVIPEATHAIVALQRNIAPVFWTLPCEYNRMGQQVTVCYPSSARGESNEHK